MARNTPPPTSDDLEPNASKPEEKSPGGAVKEIVITVAAAVLLAWFVQAFLVKPFRIPSESMENTLRCRDRVLVDRLSYRFHSPHRGDVVVFHPPAGIDENGDPDRNVVRNQEDRNPPAPTASDARSARPAKVNYIKRIIGLPGDEIKVKGHHAYVNGKRLKEPYLHPLSGENPASLAAFPANFPTVTVPKKAYLMMGDNRANSADGRFFGFVPRDFIVGKAFTVYWPLSRVGGLPKHDPGGVEASQPDPNCQEGVPNQDAA